MRKLGSFGAKVRQGVSAQLRVAIHRLADSHARFRDFHVFRGLISGKVGATGGSFYGFCYSFSMNMIYY